MGGMRPRGLPHPLGVRTGPGGTRGPISVEYRLQRWVRFLHALQYNSLFYRHLKTNGTENTVTKMGLPRFGRSACQLTAFLVFTGAHGS